MKWDNLQSKILALAYFRPNGEVKLHKPCVLSPDAGGVTRAKGFQKKLLQHGYTDTTLAMIIKQRSGPGQIESMHLIGSVKGRDVIIFDDLIDTGGTLCKAADVIKKLGARKVYAFATHGLFSTSESLKKIEKSSLD